MPTTATPFASTPATAGAAALPEGIEIFRAGRHTDDAGRVHEFSEADLDGMAASYSPQLREALLCVGHPQDNLPAYGWVKSVGRNAQGVLTIATHSVEPQFAEMVAARRFPKRSASFYPPNSPNNPTPGKWYLRHVAFLGAQPPAIAGLKDIQFAAHDEGVVCFSEATTPTPTSTTTTKEVTTMTEEEIQTLKAKLQAAEAEAAQARKEADAAQQQAASFAEKARAERQAGFVSFAQAQVQSGRILPKDEAMLAATLGLLADAQPVQFSEGGTTTKVAPVQWLQDLVATGPKVVSFGEFAGATHHTPGGAGSARGKSDAEIDTAAQAYATAQKVDYAQALKAVTASFTTTATTTA